MRSHMHTGKYKNNCPISVEYHVECVLLESSFDIYGIYCLMIILNILQVGNQKDRQKYALSGFEAWQDLITNKNRKYVS